ncbi:hypothetical protein ABW19_dt0203351 [Dactylella cylindrospora]|nr:hypothetical protein ABW19_dt0203351 [Dactylella cylindrospora]
MDLRPESPPPPIRRKKQDTQASAAAGKPAVELPGKFKPTSAPNPPPGSSPSVVNGQNGAAKVSVTKIDLSQPGPNLRRVECFAYDSGQHPKTENAVIKEDEIQPWLTKPVPKSFNGKAPIAGLQLLCCRQQVSMLNPFSEETFKSINETLGLPQNYSYLTACNAGACGKFMVENGVPVFIYHRSNNNGTVSAILRWNSTTNFTLGYLLLGPRISMQKVAADLVSQFPSFAHPLFVPTYLGECTAADLMRELHQIHSMLARAERRTRFGDWELQDTASEMAAPDDGNEEYGDEKASMTKMAMTTVTKMPVATATSMKPMDESGDSDSEDEEAVVVDRKNESRYWTTMRKAMDSCGQNYHVLSRILGTLSCRFAFMDVAVECSIAGVEATRREMEKMHEYCGSSARLRQLNVIMNSDCLGHRIDLLLSNLKHIKKFGAIGQRMQVQRDVLFNLIAQDENTLNMSIAADSKQLAEASKRDSSAMKILAILTTVFLPATFVATLFAMPLFNWGAGNMSGVMSDRLWIYWTIAIPLSLAVMGIAGTYALVQGRRNRLAADKARKKAGFKEA